MKHRLTLASAVEISQFEKASIQSGLDSDMRYLESDPLAKDQRKKSRGFDHVHLSVVDKNLVQWYGRSSNGYHYPIGSVMKIIKDQEG